MTKTKPYFLIDTLPEGFSVGDPVIVVFREFGKTIGAIFQGKIESCERYDAKYSVADTFGIRHCLSSYHELIHVPSGEMESTLQRMLDAVPRDGREESYGPDPINRIYPGTDRKLPAAGDKVIRVVRDGDDVIGLLLGDIVESIDGNTSEKYLIFKNRIGWHDKVQGDDFEWFPIRTRSEPNRDLRHFYEVMQYHEDCISPALMRDPKPDDGMVAAMRIPYGARVMVIGGKVAETYGRITGTARGIVDGLIKFWPDSHHCQTCLVAPENLEIIDTI